MSKFGLNIECFHFFLNNLVWHVGNLRHQRILMSGGRG